MQANSAPLTDAIIIAVSRLLDDSQKQRKREPTHSDLSFLFSRVGLTHMDPKANGQTVGKAKRVRAVLSSALNNDIHAGELLIKYLIDTIKGFGGFRKESLNFVGQEAIENATSVFKSEGYVLSSDGDLHPLVLDNLTEKGLTQALVSYVKRARKGSLDAALLAGTGKDLLEAVAKHVLQVKWGQNSFPKNFPTLLGQAFTALDMYTPSKNGDSKLSAIKRYESSLYQLGCSVNTLRNKEGTGHGRPFLASISDEDAQNVVQSIGVVSDYMLRKLEDLHLVNIGK
ncbi:abortive infection family protein [Lentibacillus sp. CBA3610]|uniref:abortive infection family protein n=1 Tax=Lentibacillus sp. CBA3610 TaxID=2518176 RepID=UPI0015962758|nr:abortive infection family protein [Lentibacillus sp. CBA3610]QKY70296.1 hypothetical protein Len3610_12455 [Lentibacillus sp. CBA3610]